MQVKFILNGKPVEHDVPVTRTLLEMLRRDFSLTAAKEGCGKGECGACTILLNGQPINSCLKIAATLKPSDNVQTLEGLADDGLMQKIQESFVEEGAVQCGFCIPGMVMSSYTLLKHHPTPDEGKIKEAVSGNLCRCTGYTKILKAIQSASAKGK